MKVETFHGDQPGCRGAAFKSVSSMVAIISGNATCGNAHQHLPFTLTGAAGWQVSNHAVLQQICLESSDEVLSA